ncbi:MAG: MBL fold metallo-hydrolase [Verrucomicrobiia bacterium]|jgi:phosphoribosyl 1,2-cyclic phosphodiesterase
MHITILGSGSAGNCTLIETDTTRLLVDAGLSGRQIARRLALINRNIDQISGVILTHEHSDHVCGLGVLCKARPLPVYANRLTAEAVTTDPDWPETVRISWRLFSTGGSFEVGDLLIESFSVPHDAYDPVGYVIRQPSSNVAVGVLTDLGQATKLVTERVRQMDALVVEANHDLKLLQEDAARPWALKQRIMSRHGHLSNDAAATLAGDVACDKLRHVFLAHLSRDCNRPELAQQAVADKLRQIGARHIAVAVSSQDKPTATLTL